jgi:ring-1,2-phenylacetyl-CoA epoxidase subunit PaaC
MSSQQQDTVAYAIALGDDALVLGQRLSEWCSRAPFLEEDLALANVALDFMGRARMCYGYAATLEKAGRTEDDIAFLRDGREFRNLLIHELPRGDFAWSCARQYLVDAFNLYFLEALTRSTDAELAAIAGKSVKETRYHLRRSRDWMLRLGDGTDESHRRVQDALEQVWGYTQELFTMASFEQRLLDSGIAVDRTALRGSWDRELAATLAEAGLSRPRDDWSVLGGREGIHTEHLGPMLAEMQHLQRAYPGLQW